MGLFSSRKAFGRVISRVVKFWRMSGQRAPNPGIRTIGLSIQSADSRVHEVKPCVSTKSGNKQKNIRCNSEATSLDSGARWTWKINQQAGIYEGRIQFPEIQTKEGLVDGSRFMIKCG
jgi:hypothetical protein